MPNRLTYHRVHSAGVSHVQMLSGFRLPLLGLPAPACLPACLPACRMLGTAFFHYAAALGILALCVLFCNLRRLSSTSLVSLPLAFCVVSVFVSFSFCVALPLPLLACGSSPLPSRVWAFAAPKFQRIRS